MTAYVTTCLSIHLLSLFLKLMHRCADVVASLHVCVYVMYVLSGQRKSEDKHLRAVHVCVVYRIYKMYLRLAWLFEFGSRDVCMYVYMYVRMYACMYVCMYICMYVCMYVCEYLCMYMCVCIYVCIFVY
jgi:hypothetical protein